MGDVLRFNETMLQNVTGFVGGYNKSEVAASSEAFALLRQQYAKPQADLEELVNLAWPHREVPFTLPHETD